MSNRLTLSWRDVEYYVNEMLRQIHISDWRPDVVIGVDRGGLPISTMLSHYLGVPHETVKVSLRDNPQTESLLWAPEDVMSGKKILIVDDINDSGATQAWLAEDWASSVSGVEPDFIEKFWHDAIRFAAMVDNEASEQYTDYCGLSVNKSDNDVWIDFPWESWWNRSTL
jgi:hypoxanthine phosphoribosyltransferase